MPRKKKYVLKHWTERPGDFNNIQKKKKKLNPNNSFYFQ